MHINRILTSALFYGFAFWYPTVLWWGTLASMIVLMPISLTSPKRAFWYGSLWGIIAYTLHSYGIAVGVARLAAYASWYAWLPGVAAIIYLALCTGFFWAVGIWWEQSMKSKVLHTQYTPSLTRTFWMWLYWLWISYGCLFFCGRCEGYLFANPLLPWAAHPQLLWPVSWWGIIGATFFLCMLSACITYNLERKKYLFLSTLLFFVGTNLVQKKTESPDSASWHTKVGVVTTPIITTSEDHAICAYIAEHIACAHARNPNLCALIFPESCIYPWRICAESLLIEYLPHTNHPCDYLIGSFYDDNGLYRNSCYWFHDGILQKRFDKRHAMPIIERLPWFLRCTTLKKLFFATMPEIVPSCNERPIMHIGDTEIVPYICSELFFNRCPDDHYHELPIVALINDRWAPPYLQNLIFLGAVIQAHAWHREILYVSYTRNILIGYQPPVTGFKSLHIATSRSPGVQFSGN